MAPRCTGSGGGGGGTREVTVPTQRCVSLADAEEDVWSGLDDGGLEERRERKRAWTTSRRARTERSRARKEGADLRGRVGMAVTWSARHAVQKEAFSRMPLAVDFFNESERELKWKE